MTIKDLYWMIRNKIYNPKPKFFGIRTGNKMYKWEGNCDHKDAPNKDNYPLRDLPSNNAKLYSDHLKNSFNP